MVLAGAGEHDIVVDYVIHILNRQNKNVTFVTFKVLPSLNLTKQGTT